MFSSLTSFLFGSSTSVTTRSEPNKTTNLEKGISETQLDGLCAEDSTRIKVNVSKSLTGGARNELQQEPRVKNKRNNKKNKNKKQITIEKNQTNLGHVSSKTSNDEFDIDENDWYFVEKDDVHTCNSLHCSISKEKSNLVGDNNWASLLTQEQKDINTFRVISCKLGASKQYSTRQKRNRDSNARYLNTSGRDTANDDNRKGCPALQSLSLSSPRSFLNEEAANGARSAKTLTNGDISQPLHAVPDSQESVHNVSGSSCDSNGSGAKFFTMVDSWYLTPPPCFTSTGPVHLEISPFENLLIEHPSMSVYHSIRSAQKTCDNFVNFDLEGNEAKQMQLQPQLVKNPQNVQLNQEGKENSNPKSSPRRKVLTSKLPAAVIDHNTQAAAGERVTGPRIDRFTAAQLKMELFAWNSQKCLTNRNRQDLCRNAILRANQVRGIQGRGNRQRRADMQHCQLVSGVNNNRKCCF